MKSGLSLGRDRAIVSQTNIGTVSKTTLEKPLRDGVERIWASPSAQTPSLDPKVSSVLWKSFIGDFPLTKIKVLMTAAKWNRVHGLKRKTIKLRLVARSSAAWQGCRRWSGFQLTMTFKHSVSSATIVRVLSQYWHIYKIHIYKIVNHGTRQGLDSVVLHLISFPGETLEFLLNV